MKILHLADLHLGKKVNGFSMIEDQMYILEEIIEIVKREETEAVIIAGDVYDKPVPPRDAVQLLDSFLVTLSKLNQKVFVISGNHDAAERISFGRKLMENKGIYMSPVYDGKVEPITLEDDFGKVSVYMLPFIKPAHVRAIFKDETIESYTDAIKCAIEHMNVDTNQRNIIIAHQFVGGADRCDSEEISVGGLDNVAPSVFKDFDYTALGHIHRGQNAGGENIRYAGTPLKYSISEKDHKKSVTILELLEKGQINIDTISLVPKRDLREIKGTYEELTLKDYYENQNREDYIHVVLTDEEDVPDALARLRVIYPNIMKLDYDNTRTSTVSEISMDDNIENKSEIELFQDLYKMQNGVNMSKVQEDFVREIFEKLKEREA